MSTRSQIGFYESENTNLTKPDVLLYRHWDGYPEGVLPDILPFLAWFDKARGLDDIEYAGARLLQYLCNQADKSTLESAKKYPNIIGKEISKGFTGTLGHGICKGFHVDIEYYYAIYQDRVEVYDNVMAGDWDNPGPITNRARLMLTLKFSELPEQITRDWVESILPKEEN